MYQRRPAILNARSVSAGGLEGEPVIQEERSSPRVARMGWSGTNDLTVIGRKSTMLCVCSSGLWPRVRRRSAAVPAACLKSQVARTCVFQVRGFSFCSAGLFLNPAAFPDPLRQAAGSPPAGEPALPRARPGVVCFVSSARRGEVATTRFLCRGIFIPKIHKPTAQKSVPWLPLPDKTRACTTQIRVMPYLANTNVESDVILEGKDVNNSGEGKNRGPALRVL